MTSIPYWLRVAIAFAVAPLAPVLVFSIIVFFWGKLIASPYDFFVIVCMLAILFGYPGIVLLGFPVFGCFLATRRTLMSYYILGGCFTGYVIVPAVMVLLIFLDEPDVSLSAAFGKYTDSIPPEHLLAGPLGALGGFCFWLIARPDRRPL